MAHDRNALRAMVRGAYDLQKLRIQTGLRLCANFRAKLGQSPPDSEDELDEIAKDVLKKMRASFRRLTDGIARGLPSETEFKGDEIISTWTELALVAQYLELDSTETRQFARLERALAEFPIYTQFLNTIVGIGPAMAGVIVSEFDIHKARYPSSLWAYAGLDVANVDGLGRSKRREHLVKREYVNRAGNAVERDSITYNPFVKTKLAGVLGPSFLRTKSAYARYYYDYKHRLETDPARIKTKRVTSENFRTEWRAKRIHDAAIRYMVKQFLKDLYNAWRPLENLPVAPTYQEAKLGHVHGSGPTESMRGMFNGLTDAQKAAALAYRGDENHGAVSRKPTEAEKRAVEEKPTAEIERAEQL